MNFFKVNRKNTDGWKSVQSELTLPDLSDFATDGLQDFLVGIRPEHIEILDAGDAPDNPWVFEAQVQLAELLGADALLSLSIRGETMLARVNGAAHPEQGAKVYVQFDPERLHVFDLSTKHAVARSNAN